MRPDHHRPLSPWEPPGPGLEAVEPSKRVRHVSGLLFRELIWEAEKGWISVGRTGDEETRQQ